MNYTKVKKIEIDINEKYEIFIKCLHFLEICTIMC